MMLSWLKDRMRAMMVDGATPRRALVSSLKELGADRCPVCGGYAEDGYCTDCGARVRPGSGRFTDDFDDLPARGRRG